MRGLVLIVIMGVLAGCGNTGRYAAAAEDATKDAKNIEAGILEDAPCLIGMGAWGRMPDMRKRNAVFLLCVSDAESYGVKLE